MSARWSTTRATAIASALAIGGSAMVAMPAIAAPGEANASAVKMQLSLELGGTAVLEVDAAAATKGPPGGELLIPDLSAHFGTLKGAAAAGVATLDTVSGEGGSSSSALVEDLSVSVLGVSAVSAQQVSSSADCISGALPEAETDAQGVTVLGTEVDPTGIPAEGLELKASATVPGMTRADVIAKVRPGSTSSNASSAKVNGLSVNLLLKGKVTEVGEIASIWLGRISIGDVSCERVDRPAAPSAEELTPADGVTTGGDTVTMHGSGFTADTTVSVGGKAAGDVVVLSDTELSFETPANVAGPAAVTATTPSGTTNALEFIYNEPAPEAPEVDELDPDEVAATGGKEVWVFGSGFISGRTSVTIGDKVISPSDVEVMNTGTLIIKAPAHPAGTVPVSVTTPVGTSGSMELTYLAVTVPPTITSVSPNSGPLEGNNVVTLRGTGFVPGATSVTMDTASFLDDDVTVISDTELSFLAPAGTEGPVTIFITTAAGPSNEVTYTYSATAVPTAPTAVSLTPSSGPAAGGTPVTVVGDGFLPGETSVTIGGVNIPVESVTVTSATELSFIAPEHASGNADVAITTPHGTSNALSYSYEPAPQPSVAIQGHDFSGDGNPDVLARDSKGNLWLYSGNGTGGWLKKTAAGTGWNSMTSIVAPGDFDGDKKVDLLARDSKGNLWLYSG
ncbi:IPT/TIG domain-containing protein, partial [Arthrobacter sp.]|uniref:IPT/TIG domain-containing protein n=1 Tax=Arthrobacter sp. TaxID=1667 RepID=UPI0028127B4F